MHRLAILKMLGSSWVTMTTVKAQDPIEGEDELVELDGAHRVEAGGRLVEEEERGLERHGARDGGALLHAARDLRGEEILGAIEAHELQLRAHDGADGFVRELGPLLELQADVLPDGERPEERTPLEHHAEGRPARLQVRMSQACDGDLAGHGRLQSDEVSQQRRFAAPAATEDREDFAVVDVKRRVLLQNHARPIPW